MPTRERNRFNFENLFIFEMANNHGGSVEHGKRIIAEVARVAKAAGVRGAVKLQFRDLDTFIHPRHRDSKTNKHIARFLGTRLSEDEFSELVGAARAEGFSTMCTPFDEASVDKILRLGIDVIKIGSCSAQDWPLLERVAEAGKPIVCSTGGLSFKEMDKVVSFFEHRGADFALMHCVSVYPTPAAELHLNQIELMRERYPGITIGFSTHEEPNNTIAIGIAYAKGARIFEKHMGVPTEAAPLNAYSAAPAELAAWIAAWKEAVASCGSGAERSISARELEDLASLKRGVYAKKRVEAGAPLKRSEIFFAMPLEAGQLSSGRWREHLLADRAYEPNEPIENAVLPPGSSRKEIIYSTIHAVKGMLHASRIPLGHEFSVELSHHFGLDRFHEVGCTLIECVNREYAKKLVVQLPGQWNPPHYHRRKDETFQVLSGRMTVELEGKRKTLEAGDTLWVPRGVWHAFGTENGVIFEEISTASFNDDSFYLDKTIAGLPRDLRKTRLYNWGRHQFDEFDEAGNVIGQYA